MWGLRVKHWRKITIVAVATLIASACGGSSGSSTVSDLGAGQVEETDSNATRSNGAPTTTRNSVLAESNEYDWADSYIEEVLLGMRDDEGAAFGCMFIMGWSVEDVMALADAGETDPPESESDFAFEAELNSRGYDWYDMPEGLVRKLISAMRAECVDIIGASDKAESAPATANNERPPPAGTGGSLDDPYDETDVLAGVSGFFSDDTWDVEFLGLYAVDRSQYAEEEGDCWSILANMTPTKINKGLISESFSSPAINALVDGQKLESVYFECDEDELGAAGAVSSIEVTEGTTILRYVLTQVPVGTAPEDILVLVNDESVWRLPVLDAIPS
jgi:hypothetical protein